MLWSANSELEKNEFGQLSLASTRAATSQELKELVSLTAERAMLAEAIPTTTLAFKTNRASISQNQV